MGWGPSTVFPECLNIPFIVTSAKAITFKGLQNLNWRYLYHMFLSGAKERLGERSYYNMHFCPVRDFKP
jgi:hypothetical protein